FLALLLSVLMSTTAWAQERVVTGKVTDATDGSALPGVTVLVEGTTRGTVTDIDGLFSVNVDESEALIFSFVGYDRMRVEVGSQTNFAISLYPDITQLGEIV